MTSGSTSLNPWFLSPELRQKIADAAYRAVLENCTLSKKDDMVTYFEQN